MVFTIYTHKGLVINIHSVPYKYGGEVFEGEVWDGEKCIHKDVYPNGFTALKYCESVVSGVPVEPIL